MCKLLAFLRTGYHKSLLRHPLHQTTSLALVALAAIVPQIIEAQPARAKSTMRPNIVFINDLAPRNPERVAELLSVLKKQVSQDPGKHSLKEH